MNRYWTTIIATILIFGCGPRQGSDGERSAGEVRTEFDPMQLKGVGPVTSVYLDDVPDAAMAAAGRRIFDRLCAPCHQAESRTTGPALRDVTRRRSPEWLMNMILNPEEMVRRDPLARALNREYSGSPMPDQGLDEPEARAVLEYLRTLGTVAD